MRYHIAVFSTLVYAFAPAIAEAQQQFTTFDLGAAMMQAEQVRAQREQIRLQQEQAEYQRRLHEQQVRALELENQRREAEFRQSQALQAELTATPAQAALYENWMNAVTPRMGRYPDFMSVILAPDLVITDSMVALMAGTPYAADIAYYLGTNKDEARRIAKMSLLDQALAIKEIERKTQPQ